MVFRVHVRIDRKTCWLFFWKFTARLYCTVGVHPTRCSVCQFRKNDLSSPNSLWMPSLGIRWIWRSWKTFKRTTWFGTGRSCQRKGSIIYLVSYLSSSAIILSRNIGSFFEGGCYRRIWSGLWQASLLSKRDTKKVNSIIDLVIPS